LHVQTSNPTTQGVKAGSILLILLLVHAAHAQRHMDYGEGPWGRLDFIWTELSPEKCGRVTKLQDRDFRACPPVAGYQLLYGGDEAHPDVIVVGPNRKQHVIQYWDLTSDNFVSLSKRVTWQIARSRTGKVTPLSLGLEADVKVNPFWRFGGPYTILTKLTPAEVCVVGRVPSGPYEAEDLASLRGWAPSAKCIPLDNIGRKDWLGVVYGLTASGRYEEAKATLKEIKKPSTRTVAYIEIARAEADNGHQDSARATLLRAWDEALKQDVATKYVDEYGRQAEESRRDDDKVDIIHTMAAIGLDDDVNERLKLITTPELPDLLVVVGRAQGVARNIGGRGDRVAANATLKRAIQLALSSADTGKADRILCNILEAQLDVGLINEARETVLLIKGPMTRKAAEYTLSVRAPR
jgi:hypothetical protein